MGHDFVVEMEGCGQERCVVQWSAVSSTHCTRSTCAFHALSSMYFTSHHHIKWRMKALLLIVLLFNDCIAQTTKSVPQSGPIVSLNELQHVNKDNKFRAKDPVALEEIIL